MIFPLLEGVRGRVSAADALSVRRDRVVVVARDGDVIEARSGEELSHRLRVFREGRVGTAGAVGPVNDLASAALSAATNGDMAPPLLPAESPLPQVATTSLDTATAPLAELTRLARRVNERVRKSGRTVLTRVVRTMRLVHVANSRGVNAEYETSRLSLAVDVQLQVGDSILTLSADLDGAEIPDDGALGQLAADLQVRMKWVERLAEPPRGGAVILMPHALAALLAPVLGELAARDSAPENGTEPPPAFSPDLTFIDDPLAAGRPGSRPIDDECVVTSTAPLIDQGVLRRIPRTLVAGGLTGRPASGNAWWPTFARPFASPNNVRLRPGVLPLDALVARAADGIVVDRVAGGASGLGGSFVQPVLLGFRVEGGAITGRVDGIALRGSFAAALRGPVGLGADTRWIGNAELPPILVEGIALGSR